MKKNKGKEQIYQEIYKEMPKNLNEKEIAAFIMMKIAKERSFSSKYYWGNTRTREKIYEDCVKKNNKKREDKRQLICVTATKIYKDIAKRFGLDVYIIGDTKLTDNDYTIFKLGEHISPVIKTKDGKYIKVDIEWDLENIQTGRRWIKFGSKDKGQDTLTELSEEELDAIMQKIGYINTKEDYLENYLEKLNLSDSSISLKNRVNKIFLDKKIAQRVSFLKSDVDIYRFYRKVIKDYIPENKNITLFGGYSEDRMKKIKKYTILTYLGENKNNAFWIWSNRKNQMQDVSAKMMKQFIKKGVVKIIPGKNIDKYQKMMNRIDKEKEACKNKEISYDEIWIDRE